MFLFYGLRVIPIPLTVFFYCMQINKLLFWFYTFSFIWLIHIHPEQETILNMLRKNRLLQPQAWKWDPRPWFIHHRKEYQLMRWPGEDKILLPLWRPCINDAMPSTNSEVSYLHSISQQWKFCAFYLQIMLLV